MKKSFLLGLVALLLPLTLLAQDKKIVLDYKTKVTYAGNETKNKLELSLKAGGTPLSEGTDFWLTDETGNMLEANAIHDAKTYTVKVKLSFPLEQQGYTCDDLTFEVERYTIKKLSLVEGYKELAKVTYGDVEQLEGIKLEDFVKVLGTDIQTGDDPAKVLECVSLQKTENTQTAKNVGDALSVYVNPVSADENESNYVYDPTGEERLIVPITIEPRVLTLTFTGREFKVQNGKPYETPLTALANADDAWSFGEGEVLEGDDVTISLEVVEPVDAKLMKVGIYELKPTVIGSDVQTAQNYTFAEDYTSKYEISKAKLTIARTTEVAEKTYGENEDLYALFTYTTVSPTGQVTLTKEQLKDLGVTVSRENDENVKYNDEKKVVGYDIDINPGENFTLAGYDKKVQFTINPKSISAEGRDGYKAGYITVNEPENKDEFVTYIGEDYVKKYRDEAPNDIEGLSLVDTSIELKDLLDEDGEVRTLVAGKDYTLVFSASAAQEYKAKNAGEKFTITFEAKGNYTGKIWSSGYTIGRAELAIKLINKEGLCKVAGTEDPDFYELFDYEDLVGEDEDHPENVLMFKRGGGDTPNENGYWVKLYTPDGNTEIWDNNLETGLTNYKVVEWDRPRFVVLADEITLYGSELPEGEKTNSEKLAQYNGKEVTVKIKNFVEMYWNEPSFYPECWNSMVLPFKTKASKVAEQLGYGVVDIFNKENNRPGEISFSLTVGDIPANHLFLVKLAEEKDLTEDLVFEGVTIEYDPDENGEIKDTDKGNNVFYAVYEDKLLDNDASLFFVVESVFASTAKYNDVTVHPLNGYIKSGAAQPRETRFIIEEADGSTTSIDAITGETLNYAAEGWYTIGGIKLEGQPTQKGIYINNGKKVVIK